MDNKYKILSVGGSIVIPKTGFNVGFLKKFRKMILKRVAKGERFVLVIGGGWTCRQYQEAAKKVVKLNNTQLDEIGIYSTKFNAQFVRYLFSGYTPDDIVVNPTQKLDTDKPIIIASGWKPGCSSDTDAVILAKTYGAHEVFNLSNIKYVYDKDPSRHKNAKIIKEIDWTNFRKNIVGDKWEAGKSLPFDPIASREAQKMMLKVYVLDGTRLRNVEKALNGRKFKGTVIG